MAAKLKNLKVTSVDFVDKGANPDAHIMLFKRDSGTDGNAPGGKPQEEAHAGAETDILKNFFEAVGKMAGMSQDTIDATVGEIRKACAGSLEEAGKNNPAETAGALSADPQDISKRTEEGEKRHMTVDVSKMTPEEKKVYEDIVKRYGTEDKAEAAAADGAAAAATETGAAASTPAATVNAAAVGKAAPEKGSASAETGDDIYKGLHPLVAEELKRLRKRADDEDERALTEVAKKYEIIGKKPEELVPVLKALKAAGGTAYDDMIGVLDASVDAVNKSGIFTEIGKSGSYGSYGDEDAAWAKIEKKADEIQAANSNIGRHQAIDMACMQNPSLVHDYENGR